MEIGTIETISEEKPKRKNRPGLNSSMGSGGGNKNRGGGGGGGSGGSGGSGGGNDKAPDRDFRADSQSQSSNQLRVAMWFLLLVVLMTFGGLIAAYVVIATNGVLEWRPFDLPLPVWSSTFLILASSVTYKIAQRALNSNNQEKAKNWLLVTTVFGGMFISSQILAWFALIQRGVYVASNPYAGFFYILTAVHAVHVIGGIAALGYIVLRTWHKTDSEIELEARKSMSSTIGWYWHFMDALWIVLVLLLVFWK